MTRRTIAAGISIRTGMIETDRTEELRQRARGCNALVRWREADSAPSQTLAWAVIGGTMRSVEVDGFDRRIGSKSVHITCGWVSAWRDPLTLGVTRRA